MALAGGGQFLDLAGRRPVGFGEISMTVPRQGFTSVLTGKPGNRLFRLGLYPN